MADDTDFAALYRELGVAPGCTPEQFRIAYRRRVSRLHPDQHDGAGDLERVQELNRLYREASGFLRTHGRLPGAHGLAYQRAAPAMPFDDAASSESVDADGIDAKAGSHRHSRYYVALAVVAIAALALHAFDRPGRKPLRVRAERHAVPHAADAVLATTIALGMGKDDVERIQGEPVGMHEVRWDYGPSWIDFKCGGVVSDWYSSPLRPLHVDAPHPSPRDWDRFDAAPPPGC